MRSTRSPAIRARTARQHRLERLREKLIEDEKVLHEIAETWPGADLQRLKVLRRNALKEREQGKPRAFRELFRVEGARERQRPRRGVGQKRRRSRKMSDETLKLGLVSVSDRASGGVYEDKGIPALRDWCSAALSSPWVGWSG